MRTQRTEQEEVIHQLRQINAQLNPLPAFIKVGLWLFLLLCLLGLPGVVYQSVAHHPH